jgi:hypothetical protein
MSDYRAADQAASSDVLGVGALTARPQGHDETTIERIGRNPR